MDKICCSVDFGERRERANSIKAKKNKLQKQTYFNSEMANYLQSKQRSCALVLSLKKDAILLMKQHIMDYAGKPFKVFPLSWIMSDTEKKETIDSNPSPLSI